MHINQLIRNLVLSQDIKQEARRLAGLVLQNHHRFHDNLGSFADMAKSTLESEA